jgi:outer membrane biosynthesis protein TonB
MKINFRNLLLGGFLIAAFSIAAPAQMAAIAAVDEPEPAEGIGSTATAGLGRASSRAGAKSAGSASKSRKSASTKKPNAKNTSKVGSPPPPPPPPPPASYNGPILGDKYTFLNYEVTSAEKPYYTRAAKASGAKGLVQVEVVVSTDGSVISARARTGNKELWPEAERAARASKFNRPKADGRPARAMGFLVYRFGPAED